MLLASNNLISWYIDSSIDSFIDYQSTLDNDVTVEALTAAGQTQQSHFTSLGYFRKRAASPLL